MSQRQVGSFTRVNANGSAVIKPSPGVLLRVAINTLGSAGNTLTIFDNTAASGTVVCVIDTVTATVGRWLEYSCALNVGLAYTLATGGAADLTIIWTM